LKKIVHVAGMDAYGSHESGNMIDFGLFREMDDYHCTHILGLFKSKPDHDTVHIPIDEKGSQEGLENYIDADVVILHDALLQPETIRKISKKNNNCPILFRGMDLSHMTGGCPNPNTCEKWTDTCGSCPQLGHDNQFVLTGPYPHEKPDPSLLPLLENDITRDRLIRKINSWKDIPIHGVPVSTSSLKAFNRSTLFKDRKNIVMPIPYDIPVYEKSREDARKELGIPEQLRDHFFVIWGSTNPEQYRKGRSYADKALNHFYDLLKEKNYDTDKVSLLTVGPNPSKPFNETQPFNWVRTGYLSTRNFLSMAFKSANVGLQTTISDAGPMMVTECLAADTALVSFDNCVAIDMIDHGKTGFLAPVHDYIALGESLMKVYESPEIGNNASEGVRRFNNREQTKKRWIDFIEEITA
tara:strand:+ start:292 stop:1527 length:1236 start_codon:yes stop_codon:yes gene_type:complete